MKLYFYFGQTLLYILIVKSFNLRMNYVNENSFSLPKLIAFDLDGTVWSPDMYMLSGGSPFTSINVEHSRFRDKHKNEVHLLGICRELFDEFSTDKKWKDTKFAWVSCTDEPEWAYELLQKFQTSSGLSINSFITSQQIYKSNKQTHFLKLKDEFPEIQFNEMLFFDNEMYNIIAVSKLGVHCVYCPDGVTSDIWKQGISIFSYR